MRKWIGALVLVMDGNHIRTIWEFDAHRQYVRYSNEASRTLVLQQKLNPANKFEIQEVWGNWKKAAERWNRDHPTIPLLQKQPENSSEIVEKVVDTSTSLP